MKKYFEQETPYSCGASALRNVLKQFSIVKTEKHLRKVCNVDTTGTSPANLIKAIEKFRLQYREIQTKSVSKFKQVIRDGLNKGNKFILLVDNTQHYISVISKTGRKVKIIDSDFIEKGKISPELTMTQLVNMSYNYDKLTDKKYFYLIEVSKSG